MGMMGLTSYCNLQIGCNLMTQMGAHGEEALAEAPSEGPWLAGPSRGSTSDCGACARCAAERKRLQTQQQSAPSPDVSIGRAERLSCQRRCSSFSLFADTRRRCSCRTLATSPRRPSTRRTMSPESVADDEEDDIWDEDWGENDESQCTSLFSNVVLPSVEACCDHDATQHGFDLRSYCAQVRRGCRVDARECCSC